jgi:hypothetical protein
VSEKLSLGPACSHGSDTRPGGLTTTGTPEPWPPPGRRPRWRAFRRDGSGVPRFLGPYGEAGTDSDTELWIASALSLNTA